MHSQRDRQQVHDTLTRWFVVTGCFAALALAPHSAPAAAIAALGIELPTMGITFGRYGLNRTAAYQKYFSPAVMRDIRDNLKASYIRTGWIPNWVRREPVRWQREDQVLDNACGAGLHVMVIVPGIVDDRKGVDDLLGSVNEFFTRYTKREFGCLRYAEIANEADLPANGYAGVESYAAYYERVAPIVASFGLLVVTSGASGTDVRWTAALASLLRRASPLPPVTGYGFHPYGVSAGGLHAAVAAMRNAAAGGDVYVTEIGRTDPAELYETIVEVAPLTPALTIYEYADQPNEEAKYGLKDHPALFDAVRKAWAHVLARPFP